MVHTSENSFSSEPISMVLLSLISHLTLQVLCTLTACSCASSVIVSLRKVVGLQFDNVGDDSHEADLLMNPELFIGSK